MKVFEMFFAFSCKKYDLEAVSSLWHIMLARSFLSSGITVCTLETKDFLTNVAVIFLLCRSTKLDAVARWKNDAN